MNGSDPLVDISYALLAAIQSKDRAALDRYLADDFVHVGAAGDRQDKRAFIEAIEGGDYRIETLAFDTLAVEHLRDGAVVCGVQRALVTLANGEQAEGRTAFTDVFVREPSGWRIRLATSVELPA